MPDETFIETGNAGPFLKPFSRKESIDKGNEGKKLVRATKTISPTRNTGAMISPPIEDAVMYIETNDKPFGGNVFISHEKTDIIQFSNITFFYFDIKTHLVILNQSDDFKFKYSYLRGNGIQNIELRRILITALHQQIGL